MKNRLKVALPVVLATFIFLTGAGYAQSYGPASPLYFGVFGGYVAPQDMTWTSNVTGTSADLSLDSSGMMGLKMGYILPQARALAFELEWNYMFNQTIPSPGRLRGQGIGRGSPEQFPRQRDPALPRGENPSIHRRRDRGVIHVYPKHGIHRRRGGECGR